jgi:NDP-sugar pyrophosphorylase family protein
MKQAMIFAAGLGTRLKPLTDTTPKALVRVGGQPLLWHVVQKLKAAGYERLVVNVHHFAEQIIDYLRENGHFGLDIRISDETGGLLETGGGIKKALPLFDPSEPILIHNVDILSNLDFNMLSAVVDGTSKPDALLVVSSRKTKRYLLFDDEMLLDGWTNIETGEVRSPYKGLDPTEMKQLAFSGIHIIWPHVFPLFADMPERFGIIDFYLKYCHQCAFLGYEKKDLRLMDVGKLDTLQEAETFIKQL